jgi:hypothetical protein
VRFADGLADQSDGFHLDDDQKGGAAIAVSHGLKYKNTLFRPQVYT